MKTIICITGETGSGKTTVANLLSMRGFEIYPMIGVIKELYHKKSFEVLSRNNIIEFASEKRILNGNDFFIKEMLLKKKFLNSERIIVDGIRFLDEFILLKTKVEAKIIMLGVVADFETRLKRVLNRKKISDPQDAYQFTINNEVEGNSSLTTTSQQIKECLIKCDELILNQSTLIQLEKNIFNFILKYNL